MTPLQFALDYIPKWEGGYSNDPDDAGNWSTGVQGKGNLLGSNHGVTSAALASYRHTPVGTLTKNDMINLSLGEASALALKLFYSGPGLDKLFWNHVTASIMDFGWTSGTETAVIHLQRLLGLNDDGKVGPVTIQKYKDYCTAQGEVNAAKAWADERNRYYDAVVAAKPVNQKYIKGWKNRSAYFTSGSDWWKRFSA